MKKRILAGALAALTVVSALSGCGGKDGAADYVGTDSVSGETKEVTIDGVTYEIATDLTDQEIEISYFSFDQQETIEYLADIWNQLYPNIKVTATFGDVSTYDDTLLTMVSNQQSPDIIMFSDADFALSNQLLMDISSYWDSDPETKELATTINDCEIGTFQSGGRFAVPVKFFPGVVYVDRNVLETLNLEVPTQQWTWNEMIQLIKDATVLDSSDGMAYYGLSVYNRLDSLYGVAAAQSIIGEFGYDGTDFDLATWAVGEQEMSDLKIAGYVAPVAETPEMEKWMGDWYGWAGASGHVAVITEAYWTYQGTWATEAYDELNLDVVPYVIPAVSEEDASADHHSIATIDFGGVTNGCAYPREAYEVLKFFSFGINGWKARIAMYNDETVTDSSGLALKHVVMPAPITTNEEIWAAYIDMYCAGMDDEHRGYWETYFASCMQPIPYGWTSIAGYWNYCDQYFNSIDIHTLCDNGTAKAADYVVDAERAANYYHAKAMVDYFGPSGYNILSEEDLAKYQQMVTDNAQ